MTSSFCPAFQRTRRSRSIRADGSRRSRICESCRSRSDTTLAGAQRCCALLWRISGRTGFLLRALVFSINSALYLVNPLSARFIRAFAGTPCLVLTELLDKQREGGIVECPRTFTTCVLFRLWQAEVA